MRRRTGLVLGVAAVLVAGACTGSDGTPETAPSGTGGHTNRSAATIAQPVVTGLPVADERERVDLRAPSFSHPTRVTNPLFPVSRQASVLLLGKVDGQPFRTEVTLLPDPRVVEWQGQKVETLVSQYVAYLGGRIHEVAYDLYAQADDGSVWYFGEDVFNFSDGVIVDTHGTWLAGRDGPAAMIMPSHPKVGDVYRTENIPGFVFEEVGVKAVDRRLAGPLGPVDGGLLVEELHLDGGKEGKTFAPGYGEFYTAGGGDVEALALAVPTDAATGGLPPELPRLQDGALAALRAAQAGDWRAAAAASARVRAAWDGVQQGQVPRLVEPRLQADVRRLAVTVRAHDPRAAGQAALDVAQAGLDLQLRYRPVTEVDLGRFGLWLDQFGLDAHAKDDAAINGDLLTLDYVRDRIMHALDGSQVTQVNTGLERLVVAVEDGDLAAASRAAAALRDTVDGIRTAG